MPDRKPDAAAPTEQDREKEWQQQDDEVAAITRTVDPKQTGAPSRAGITGSGSGADSERG